MQLLDGIRVVSFNHFLMGPLGVQILADLGADVIAIEPIGGAFQRNWGGLDTKKVDGESMLFLSAGRNKRSLALNLKAPEGLALARRLVERADVVTENYRPGVMEKLGLGYEAIKAANPAVIYAAASGFGRDGPYVDRPGQDLLVQALSGLAAITGSESDGARAVGVSAVDHHGAALFAVGILAALLGRERKGKGARVDVNLLSAALDLQNESLTCYLNGGKPRSIRPPQHMAGWYYPPPYGIYQTRDGQMAISLASLKALSEALGSSALAAIPDHEAYARRAEIAAEVARVLAGLDMKEARRRFEALGIWHAPVNDYEAVCADPQVRHNESFIQTTGAMGSPITLLNHPVRYDGEAPEMRLPPQPLGAQTRDILSELGYDDAEIDGLEAAGVVQGPAAEAPRQGL